MNRNAGNFALALCCGLLLRMWCLPVYGQPRTEEPIPGKSAESSSPSSSLTEWPGGPIRVVDENGKLVPVPGVTLNEFRKLFDKVNGGQAVVGPPPAIDSLRINGTLTGTKIECDVSLQARVTGTSWSSIPLRLGKLILAEPPEYGPNTEQLLKWENDGYVWWVKGGGKSANLKFKALATALEVGDEVRWGIPLPRANTCMVTLTVPEPSLQGYIRSGEGIVTTNDKNGSSELQVMGAAGDFQLGWKKATATSTTPVALLEASGEIQVKVEGKSRISSEARLKVRSFGGPVQAFRVRLPPGMELLPFSATNYTTTVIEDLPRMANTMPQVLAKASQLIEVKLERPASGVVEVRLVAVLVPDEKRTAPLEPARFDILGAVRQRGTLDAVVDGDWTLQWTEDSSVRRLDSGTDILSGTRVAARYEYFRQPCGLKLQVVPRPTRLHVEPLYIVYVEKDRLRLEAKLKYHIRGAKAHSFTMEMGDWTPISVGPESQVEADPGSVMQGVFPLQVVQTGGITGNLEVDLVAQQTIRGSLEQVSFALPRPKADIVSPATLIVVPAANMELTPQAEGIQSLAVDALPANVTLPARQQTPLVFRDLGGAEQARFAATVQLQFRRTRVASQGIIRVGRTSCEVEQRLRYNVQYEPQSEFDWWIPKSLADAMSFQALDETLEPLELARLTDEDQTKPGFVRFRVKTATAVLGTRELIIRYSLEVPTALGITRPIVSAPFIMPVTDAMLSAEPVRLTVTQGDDLQVEPTAGPTAVRWERVGSREFRGVLPIDEALLNLRITPSERSRLPGTTVQRLFLQSWLTSTEREDRVAFRLTAVEPKIRLRLPEDADTKEFVVAIDGEQQRSLGITNAGEVVIDIPEAKRGQECVIEIWYSFLPSSTPRFSLSTSLKPPAIVGVSAIRQIVWHVVTPANEHLLFDPNGYIPTMKWQWKPPFFGRQAALTQAELENWIGASSQDPLPAAANHYLFSSFGQNPWLQLTLVPRRWLLLVTAGIVLVLGLSLMYLPITRHPVVLMLAGVLVGGFGLMFPELAALAGQGALAGVLLTLIARGLRRWLIGVPKPPPVIERSRRVTTDLPATDRPSSPGSRPAISSTATATAFVSQELRP